MLINKTMEDNKEVIYTEHEVRSLILKCIADCFESVAAYINNKGDMLDAKQWLKDNLKQHDSI